MSPVFHFRKYDICGGVPFLLCLWVSLVLSFHFLLQPDSLSFVFSYRLKVSQQLLPISMDTKSLYVFYAVTTYVGQRYTIRGIQRADTTTGQAVII